MSALPMLTFTREGETLRSQSLEKEVSIGRGEGNVIRLDDRAVSRKHAIVRKTEEGIHIEKQSDFAPIRLNGVECTRALLKEGDVVDIGPFRMRLDTPKEPVREAPKPTLVAPTPIAVESPRDSEATVALSDSDAHVMDAMPTEAIGLGAAGGSPSIGDFSGQVSTAGLHESPDLARPIHADSAGADAGSKDPGTNIFGPGGDAAGGEFAPLDIDLGSLAPADLNEMPEEVSAVPFDEDAATRMVPSSVKARIEIAEGMANVTTLSLAKDEIVLGRGKECDVVLNDKKSSRKNTIIVRDGNHYRVKDLDSSNGTYVNNTPVKDVELSADDVIRVGDVEIRFIADSVDYERRKASFDAVEPPPEPGYLSASGLSPFTPPLGGAPVGYSAPPFGSPLESPAPATAPVAPTRKGIWGAYDKYFRNFKTLKPMQKVLVVLCVVLFLSWYFEDELGLSEPAKPAPKAQVKTDGKAVIAGDYDGLPPEKRAQIDEAIRKATDFLRLQDFDKAIYEVQQRVYPVLPNYAQAKEIERYAQEGKRRKDAIEEEARKKEEESKVKARIVELEKTTRELMVKKQFDAAKESFSEILSIDPDNGNVSGWKKEIEAWVEEQDRVEKEKQVQEEINKRAWDTYNEGFELHKAGKYREAIELYKKVPELGSNDGVLMKKAATMVKTCQESIRELRDPHLKKAKEFESSGDLASAFREYQAATEIDPPHPDGWSGMDRIRDVLTQKAKVLYTEAVISESYSDFATAHSKFEEIKKMAPEGSLYYQRAQRKLQSYLNFHGATEESQ
jgi:pSer/pThr/pTyr-binding forkhead associated (FHA) protein/tetratricopeptide (TPR) repeat protein